MSKALRIGILAGEKSGDNLGADFIRAIRLIHPDCCFEGIAGPAMLAQGCKSLFPMERLSVMGFVEPLARLPELLRIKKHLLRHFTEDPPDVFVGVDSPGFNLRLELSLRAAGIKTVHYVSPSVWAYAAKRIHKIKKAVDLMLVLFPFEPDIYQQHGINVVYTGHPLADAIGFDDEGPATRRRLGLAPHQEVLALLPGSRASEIKRLGPVFLQTAARCLQKFPNLHILIPCSGPERLQQVNELLARSECKQAVTVLEGDAHSAIRAADAVLTASGTATLETMLLKRPMVICYKLTALTYAIISRILKVDFIGLPNLLAGKALQAEFRQHEVTVENLFAALDPYLEKSADIHDLIDNFNRIHEQLRGGASARAATAVLRLCGRESSAA